MATKAQRLPATPANDSVGASDMQAVSPTSKELVLALIGYAGAGTSAAASRIGLLLEASGYVVKIIKFSDLISGLDGQPVKEIESGLKEGRSKFERATHFQDRGDGVRRKYGSFALSSAAVKSIKAARVDLDVNSQKIAYILDSIKHPDEVNLLRRVYDSTFRLIAVHCDYDKRFSRLCGVETSSAKYRGVGPSDVKKFMDRDAKDSENDNGQRVRDAFHLADFFLDNTLDSAAGAGMNADIDRFINLLLGNGLVRPTSGEKAIYVAYASALQAACLSRQVGSALISSDGRLVATGKNDPPKFGGGTYDEDSTPDHRCFAWNFSNGEISFVGCHNDRKKADLYRDISIWMAERLALPVAAKIVPEEIVLGQDAAVARRQTLQDAIGAAFMDVPDLLEGMPGVKDAIEYSRSIHAEMAALMAAARGGISTKGATMYVTVFPCHNCARHLVAAGVEAVFYIEPYVKSLAFELHSDSISSDGASQSGDASGRMVIAPFTGVGPRMYDDFFVKRGEIKGSGGVYKPQEDGEPFYAVRLRELNTVEDAAVGLVPDL